MAKVSVIVPVFGVEKYLSQAVESILAQTLKDIEIILIDDGSTDNCPKIIDEYAVKDGRIVAIHKQNGGYGQTMNMGLERATGEYIAILEPDDFIDSSMYEDLYSIAKHYDSDIVKSCFYNYFDLKTKQYAKIVPWKDIIPEDKSFTIQECSSFLHYHPSIWSCLYKREFLQKNNIKFPEAPGAGWTDNPFQVQTMCLAKKINYTSKPYYYWRRVNLKDSDDLKNYTIPFKRSDEIHAWLTENHVTDENILYNLYRRELAYIGIVLGMKNISDKNDCYDRIKKMCGRMDENIIFHNPQMHQKEKLFYVQASKIPSFLRFTILLKKFRDNLVRIRISSRECYVVLFGKTIVGDIT